ncbi:MAG: DUF1697 domain-containing protein [Acidimicrobiia bacterium]
MTAYVALLRGVNVGGRTLPMAVLRACAEECGFDRVSTFIQSGNVLFTTRLGAPKVASRLHDAIVEASGIDTQIALRTPRQMDALVAANPFVERADDPTKVSVAFLFPDTKPTLGAVDPAVYAPDEVAVVGENAYLHTPNGMGRTTLVPAVMKRLGLHGTVRNWRSTLKLHELVTALG